MERCERIKHDVGDVGAGEDVQALLCVRQEGLRVKTSRDVSRDEDGGNKIGWGSIGFGVDMRTMKRMHQKQTIDPGWGRFVAVGTG